MATETVTLAVEGMSCEGCESNVRAALSALPGVEEAEASHVADTVRVRFEAGAVDLARIRGAIEAGGYRVLGDSP